MTIQSVTAVHPMESNFLVPNGTFLVSLLAFAILVWIFGKYLIPPINKAMTARYIVSAWYQWQRPAPMMTIERPSDSSEFEANSRAIRVTVSAGTEVISSCQAGV